MRYYRQLAAKQSDNCGGFCLRIALYCGAKHVERLKEILHIVGDAGAGLGLAIARGFVEVTGGRLEVDDTPGGGSTFTVILPMVDDQETP